MTAVPGRGGETRHHVDSLLDGHAQAPALRILLVEDSDTVRMLTAEYLRSRGHTVIDVDCGEDAVNILGFAPVDVLFTDVKLPGMSGLDLARYVANSQPNIVLVISSGFDRAPDFNAMRIDCQFLSKPYDLSAIEHAIASIAASLSHPS